MGGVLDKFSHLSLSEEIKAKKGDGTKEEETPKKNCIPNHLVDPRSVTVGIKRTPLVLVKVTENKMDLDETPLRAKDYLETDLDEAIEAKENSKELEIETICSQTYVDVVDSSKDLCTVSQEIPESDSRSSELQDNAEENENNPTGSEVDSEVEIITVEGKIMNSPAVNKLKKTLVYQDDSPASESTPVKPKNARTPLGLVSTNNSPLPSPLGGGKPWRGIQEERVRLGLENTPPHCAPFLESVQSAPGKVGARRAKKWTRANWAQDESLII